jgi:hypothetical protein
VAAIKRRRRETTKSPRTSPHALIALRWRFRASCRALRSSRRSTGTFSIVYGDYRDLAAQTG